ncbi:MAG: GRP family sugar transporter [Lactobacillaceae bacterium]|jgi:glucose uptake protein|nr:GRP family sugar transporter [Lactobacillaceae bacterium]
MIFALAAALAWGSVGIISTLMGGRSSQQTLGTTFGALIFGLSVMFIWVIPNHVTMDSHIWITGLVSGLLWTLGQAGLYVAYGAIGVSEAYPLSVAGQLAGNALLGAALLSEWKTSTAWVVGLVAVVVIVVGAMLISAPAKKTESNLATSNPKMSQGLVAVGISTLGYMAYFIIPNLFSKFGFISQQVRDANHGINYMTSIIGPQSIGQVIGAFIIVIFVLKDSKNMWKKATWKNITTGLVWALGNLLFLLAAGNPSVGQTTASTLSQLGIIVGTFGGILVLHEKKTKDQLLKIAIGTVLVIIGAFVISKL